ncbi:MAG TPA: vWA domain-containing protein [Myxococcales bacterium LLY-WYZ-16_1]|nr:vWA domain-containing protein [Myxococcales bacterium LLY-WYZ-16_1]
MLGAACFGVACEADLTDLARVDGGTEPACDGGMALCDEPFRPDAADTEPRDGGASTCERPFGRSVDAGMASVVESPEPIEFGGYEDVDLRAVVPLATEGRRIDPPDLVFGRVKSGEIATVTVELTGLDPREVELVSPGPCDGPGAFCAALRPQAEPPDRVVLDVHYRPSVAAGTIERASLVARDPGGGAPRTIPLIGRSEDALPVVCSLYPDVDALGAGECSERHVRCKNLGLGPAVLTHIDLTGPFRIEDSSVEPPPTPDAPISFEPTGVERTFRLCPVRPGPFEVELSWGATTKPGSDIQVEQSTVSGEAIAGELTAPARAVLTVGEVEGQAQVVLRNEGIGPVEVTGVELDPPFAFAPDTQPEPRALGGGQWWLLDVVIATDQLFEDRPTRGELRVYAAGRPEPLVVELETDPPRPVRCRLQGPDGVLDLGRIRRSERLADGSPWNPQFTVGVTNEGPTACTAQVRAEGIEGFGIVRQSFGAGSMTPQSETTMRWEPGETIRFAAALGADGPAREQTGRLRLSSWGPYVVDEAVEVRADLRDNEGPRIGLELQRRPAPTCLAEGETYRVLLDGPILDGLEVLGELSGRVELRTSQPLPASGAVVAEIELPLRPSRSGAVSLRGRSEGIDFTVPLAFAGMDKSAEQIDRYEIPVPNGLDLVLVVDDSPSMARWRDNLAANLLALIQWLDEQEVDYRFFVVRASAPEKSIRIGTSGRGYVQASDPAEVRAEALTAAVGADATSAFSAAELEAPIDAAVDGTYGVRSALRRGSPLVVIVLTDEPDLRSRSVDRAASQLQFLKGSRNTRLLSLSVVGGSGHPLSNEAFGCRAAGLSHEDINRLLGAPNPEGAELTRQVTEFVDSCIPPPGP